MSPAVKVEIDARTAYDFNLSLSGMAGDAQELLPDDRRWLEQARAALPEDLRPLPDKSATTCVSFAEELDRLVFRHPEIRTARDVAAAVEAMTDSQIVEVVADELLTTPEFEALTRRAIGGSTAANSELRAILQEHGYGWANEFDLNVIGPTMRRAVAAWLEPFEEVEERVGRMEERDAAGRRAAVGTMDPLDLVEQATNGIRLVPGPNTKRVVLVPSYFGRPYNNSSHIDDTELICYPVADDALDAADRDGPPQSVLRLHRALGDESRLRILRLLRDRDRYLTELAAELELSKPTVKHHLAQLRSAGLVTLIEEGNLTYYSLRRERLDEAGAELRAFLAR